MKKLLLALAAFLLPAHALAAPSPAVPPAFTNGTEPAAIASNYDINTDIAETGSFPAAASDEGAFRSACEMSHLAYDDPIVFPGQPGVSHLHQFFGNPTTNANSTFASLRGAPGSGDTFTCGGRGINKSAYWTPVVFSGDHECDPAHPGNDTCVLRPAYAIVYYKKDTRDLAAQEPVRFPRGGAFVTGFNMGATTAWQSTAGLPAGATQITNGFNGWKCEGNVGGTVKYLRDAAGNPMLNCPTNELIGFSTSTQQCWDGTTLIGTGGRSHIAFKYRDNWGGKGPNRWGGNEWCPDTHPYEIPHFDLIVWYSHNGQADFTNWYFSSDRMPGYPTFRNGESGHSDFFPAWDDGILQAFQKDCIGIALPPGSANLPHSCVFTQFGDGRRGFTNHLGLSGISEASGLRYINPPPEAGTAENPVAGYKRGNRITPRRKPR